MEEANSSSRVTVGHGCGVPWLSSVGPHSRQVSAQPLAVHGLLAMCPSGGCGDLAGGSVAGYTSSPRRWRYGREVEGIRQRWWLLLVMSEEVLRKEDDGALRARPGHPW